MKMTLTRHKEPDPAVAETATSSVPPQDLAAVAEGGAVEKKRTSPKSPVSINDLPLVIGGEPRVDLLPPEVRTQRAAKKTRRVLAFAIVGVLLLVLLATGGAFFYATNTQTQLAAAQATTSSLSAQQLKYAKAQQVTQQVQLVQTAEKVGAAPEIDWTKYLANVQSVLPANVTIQDVTIQSESPQSAFGQPTASLEGPDVATLSFTADSPVVPLIPAWLDGLATLKGYAGAVPSSSTLNTSTGHYSVSIQMDVNSAAFANRFGTKGK